MRSQTYRRDRLSEVCERYGLDIDNDRYSGSEDVLPYLLREVNIPGWVAVTAHGEFVYVYPVESRLAAKEEAVRHIGDSTWDELPIAIVNLDTGSAYEPAYERLTWRKAHGNRDGT